MAYDLYSGHMASGSKIAGARSGRQERQNGSGPPQQGRQPQNDNNQNQQGQQ